jgi:hypothetical protein
VTVTADPPAIDEFVRSHLLLRRFVGVVGILLPFVLVFFHFGWGRLTGTLPPTTTLWDSLQSSLSAYYYTSAGNIFVGALVAFGVFLVTYRYGRWENRVSDGAGVCALLVGLCPTTPDAPTPAQHAVGIVHLVAAILFFAGMAVFCLFLFPRDPDRPLAENTVPPGRARFFRVCGVVVVVSIVWAVVVFFALDEATQEATRYLLWPESLAVITFALAWLVKGRELADPAR